MKITPKADYSALFSSLPASKSGEMSGLYSAISDYNSIKSGSYGKLVKSYYKEAAKSKAADKEVKKEENKKVEKETKESTVKTEEAKKTDSKNKDGKVSRKSDTLEKLLSSSKNTKPYTKEATYSKEDSEGKFFDSTL